MTKSIILMFPIEIKTRGLSFNYIHYTYVFCFSYPVEVGSQKLQHNLLFALFQNTFSIVLSLRITIPILPSNTSLFFIPIFLAAHFHLISLFLVVTSPPSFSLTVISEARAIMFQIFQRIVFAGIGTRSHKRESGVNSSYYIHTINDLLSGELPGCPVVRTLCFLYQWPHLTPH